jgi:hypothetical protein
VLQQSIAVDILIVLMQYGYRMSKSALNMAGATMAKDLQQSQVTHYNANDWRLVAHWDCSFIEPRCFS